MKTDLHRRRPPSARARPAFSILCLSLVWALLTQAARASGVNSVQVATDTVQKIVDLLTGDLATVLFLLVIVLGGFAWFMLRTTRAGEILGRAVVGSVIIFGAVQISDYFAFQGASL